MPKKRIAFIISSMLSGGAERVVSTLSNRLVDSYKIYIIMMVNKPVFYPLNSEITVLSCAENLKPSTGPLSALKSNYRLYKALVSYIRQHGIELCIGFMTPNNILATLAANRCGIPVVISERNNPFVESENLSLIWKYLRKVSYPRAEALVVQTEKIKSFYINFVKSEKILTIPNPVNPDFNNLEIIKKKDIVLNIGRLTEQKDQKMLIRAFANARAEGWCLKIVGEGDLRENLEALIDDLKIKEHVFLVGRRSNVEDYYSEAKIFAFSSRYEGFPNALQEAMYFGLPCVSTDCPTGPAELIAQGKSGFLVPVGDEKAMSLKLHALMRSNETRINIGEAAEKAMEKFKVETIVKEWVMLFDKFLNKKI